MIGNVAQAFASFYGYKTLGRLLSANSGLIVVLIALICVTLVFVRILNRQFPRGEPQPFMRWMLKVTVIFFIAAFVFVCGFTMFYEKKKEERAAAPLIFQYQAAEQT